MVRQSLALCLGACLLLSGCGFKLRQPPPMPASLAQLGLALPNPQSRFAQRLRQRLQSHGVKLVDPQTAASLLTVHEPSLAETIIAYGPNGLPQRYRYRLSVAYTVEAKPLPEPWQQTLAKTRLFSADSNRLASGNQERQQILRALQRDLIDSLIKQLFVKFSAPKVAIEEPSHATVQ